MEEEYPKPTSRRCQSCNSFQVVERRETKGNISVILKIHCNACRQDLVFWTGSPSEERLFKRRRNRVRRIMSRS